MEQREDGDDLDLIMTKVRRKMAFQHVVPEDAVDGQVAPTHGMPDCNNRQARVCDVQGSPKGLGPGSG